MNWSREGGRRRPARDSWDAPRDDWGSERPRSGFGSGSGGGFGSRPAGRPGFGAARPSRDVPVDQADVTATVKWFNGQKGFGFVALPDGTDAFLHASVLERAGEQDLPEGATVTCDVGRGQRGPQVVAVHSVDRSTATPGRGDRGSDRGPRERSGFAGPATGETIEGTVKWFNPEKGFGFISPDAGGKDVFIHISVVQRAGFDTLETGDRVSVTTQQGKKGPEAAAISVI